MEGLTAAGRRRRSGDERYLIIADRCRRAFLLAVADDAGTAGGGLASSLVVRTAAAEFYGRADRLPQVEIRNVCGELTEIVRACHASVLEHGGTAPGLHLMGTTLTMAYLAWPVLVVAHVGDNRCYVRRGTTLELLSTDPSAGGLVVGAGVLEGAGSSPSNRARAQLVGGGRESVAPHVVSTMLGASDAVLLCSGNLWRRVPESLIAGLLEAGGTAGEMCQRLLEAGDRAGASECMTVVLAQRADG